MKTKFIASEWIPLLGAEWTLRGNLAHVSYLLGDGTIRKIIVMHYDVIERRGRAYIRKSAMNGMKTPTL